MSKFYGQVRGMAATPATRTGSEASHIRASVQSYDGSVTMELSYSGGELWLDVEMAEGSKLGGTEVWSGTVDDFAAMCLRDMARKRD